LDRIDIELASHGGRHNGDLIITRRDFAAFGVSPKAQLRGIAGLVALGLISWKPGHASPDPAHGRAARFGILYRATRDGTADEQWRRFKTPAEVKATLARAHAGVEARKCVQRAKEKQRYSGSVWEPLPSGSKREPLKEEKKGTTGTGKKGTTVYTLGWGHPRHSVGSVTQCDV
jgi:hypothetical protein